MTPDTASPAQITEKKRSTSLKWAKEKVNRQRYKNIISKYKKGIKWDKKQEEAEAESLDKKQAIETEAEAETEILEVKQIDEAETKSKNKDKPLEVKQVDKTATKIKTESLELTPKNRIIDIKEKQFRLRFSLFFLRTILLTVGLSLAMTAPITLPWFFKFVIPDIIAIIPAFLANFILDIVNSIYSLVQTYFLSWAQPIVDFAMQMSATFNPFLVYMVLMYILNSTNVVQDDFYEDPFIDLSNIPSSAEFFATDFQLKLDLNFSEIAVFLFLISFFISIFLVIRREKKILFEFLTIKDGKKRLEQIEKAFLGLYQDKGYKKVNYVKNRFSESPKLNIPAYLVKFSPILSFVIPVVLVVIFLIL